MLPILSIVTRSEIMTEAHNLMKADKKYGRQIEHNAKAYAWCHASQFMWSRYRPLTLGEALRQAWQWARREATERSMEAMATAETEALHSIQAEKLALDMKERWTSADYATASALDVAIAQARFAALASIGGAQ